MVDYIYNENQQMPVTYVGHSQATTAMFYGLSHLSAVEMADKLSKILALGPCFIIDIQSDIVLTRNVWRYAIVSEWSRHIELDHVYQFNNGISVQTIKHYN